jgi:hypothetical protein
MHLGEGGRERHAGYMAAGQSHVHWGRSGVGRREKPLARQDNTTVGASSMIGAAINNCHNPESNV